MRRKCLRRKRSRGLTICWMSGHLLPDAGEHLLPPLGPTDAEAVPKRGPPLPRRPRR